MKIFILFNLLFKNPFIYAGFSGIIPGSGNYILNEKEIAKIFFFSESIFLLSYFISNKTIENTISSYKSFAKIYADANPCIKDEDYWINVENFYSYDDYIEYLRRKARAIYPDDKSLQDEYVEKHKLKNKWSWEDKDKWIKFMNLRERERKVEQIKRVIFLGIVINHVTSFLQTYFIAQSKIKEKKFGIKIERDKIFLEYKF